MPLEPGTRLGHYEIVSALGAGGMGEVYRARDTRLKRNVALKVLPEVKASDPERLKRFQREAETVAGLSHPNIVHLYSVEETEGGRFLTMELVEGESLDRLIPGDGLPLEQVFRLGAGVADALAAAHEKGVIHRDLKPANVMVGADGRPKVLDFGLAKLAGEEPPLGGEETEEESATRSMPLTREGAVMGTVPYMSPEQLRGGAVDHRSDIFSLGILLYEMATGRRPFRGPSRADVTSSILKEKPPLLNELKPELPRHLARIVAHCLEKEPQRRIQSALDVRNELEALSDEVRLGPTGSGPTGSGSVSRVSTPEPSGAHREGVGRGRALWLVIGVAAVAVAAVVVLLIGRGPEMPAPVETPAVAEAPAAAPAETVDPHSIAVLPFADMSPGKDQEYFSDGISEELLNLLAKVPELKVTARTSSFSFKGKEVEIPEIARQLHVSHVLEGSVRKSGDQVRITAQLIHAADGFHVWSQTWDRTLDDIFAIQDEIAGEVVRELKVTLLGAAPTSRTTDPQAYALYLQAVQLGRQLTAEGLAESDGLYRRVLEIDPRYAPAWDGLAYNLLNEAGSGLASMEEGYPRAREAAEKALAIDPQYAPAHARLGLLAMLGNDLGGAAKHLERALSGDPTDLDVLYTASVLLGNLGRLDEALALEETIVRRDPVNVRALTTVARAQRQAGRLDEAVASSRTVLSLSPGQGYAHYTLGVALLLKGDATAALAEIEEETSEVWRLIGLAMAYHALGREADSDAALADLIAKYERDFSYNIAYVHAFRGETDEAFEWLGKAVEYRDGGLAWITAEDLFAPIHDDPRWLPFLRSIGKAPEQLAAIPFEVTLPRR